MLPIFECSFPSRLENGKASVESILCFLDSHVSKKELDDYRLIFSELVYNSILHGNQSLTDRNVKTFIEIKEGFVFAKIYDEGSGFSLEKKLVELNLASISDSATGRGLILINALTDEFDYCEAENYFQFKKKIFDVNKQKELG